MGSEKQAPLDSNPFRILSFNIHKGFDLSNRKHTLSDIREAIRASQADLVFLQEVRGAPDRAQFEFLADEIWNHYAYGMNAVYTGGHHGNAILSKFPFVSWENIDVSTSRLSQRGILHGVIEAPPGSGLKIHCICLHFGLFHSERSHQLERLCERVQREIPEGAPLLIAGDFNDWQERSTQLLETRLGVKEVFQSLHRNHARSFPSVFPLLRLDRVYVRGFSPTRAEVRCEASWRVLSDHLALYSELKLT